MVRGTDLSMAKDSISCSKVCTTIDLIPSRNPLLPSSGISTLMIRFACSVSGTRTNIAVPSTSKTKASQNGAHADTFSISSPAMIGPNMLPVKLPSVMRKNADALQNISGTSEQAWIDAYLSASDSTSAIIENNMATSTGVPPPTIWNRGQNMIN